MKPLPPSVAYDPPCLEASLSHNVSFTESRVFELLELTFGAILRKLLMLHVIQLPTYAYGSSVLFISEAGRSKVNSPVSDSQWKS